MLRRCGGVAALLLREVTEHLLTRTAGEMEATAPAAPAAAAAAAPAAPAAPATTALLLS